MLCSFAPKIKTRARIVANLMEARISELAQLDHAALISQLLKLGLISAFCLLSKE
jgi:hypothetical protein